MPATNNKTASLRRWFAAIPCVCIALGLMAISEEARSAPQKDTVKTTTNASPKKKGSAKVKHHRSPSEESAAERDRRLYRECKGRPNAGACSGYT
ncbi:hypothetical protein [Acidovorax sp.]|uniref:hypothetical protein n=1 Tax=Acidovorax sp. TaxID=1872122 RepID=UPI0026386624|nr:hypothetical protein [Acidovorax sp.]